MINKLQKSFILNYNTPQQNKAHDFINLILNSYLLYLIVYDVSICFVSQNYLRVIFSVTFPFCFIFQTQI